MKVKRYFVIGPDQGLAGAIGDAMALFHIPESGTLPAEQFADRLPPESLAVRVACADTVNPVLVTEVFFWREPGVLGCHLRRSCLEQGEEAGKESRHLVKMHLLSLLRDMLGQNPGPWGILRGVRPTKIVHKLLDSGLPPEKIVPRLTARYAVEVDRAKLLIGIALRQRPFLRPAGSAGRQVAVYIGIPFCPSRCLYCSFPAYVLPADRSRLDVFLAALYEDMRLAVQTIKQYGLAVESVYVGGGTPTSLPAGDFAELLTAIRRLLIQPTTREFTVEAGRPDSITDGHIAAMANAGVNRVSVNPQTMQEKTLKLIGRNHTTKDIIEIFGKIRQSGLPVINMDVIVGLPGETERDVRATLDAIASLGPENLTVHTLAVKRGSRLREDQAAINLPETSVIASMLEIAREYAANMGMEPYYLYRQKNMAGNFENVGYAKPGSECIYNIQIIEERQTIIGIGPAAGTKAVADDFRLNSCYNPKDLSSYLQNLQMHATRRGQLLAGLYGNEEEFVCK